MFLGQVAVFGSAVCLLDLASARSADARLAVIFFAVAAILFASMAALMRYGSRRAVAAALFGMGFLAPAYLGGLAAVHFTGAGPSDPGWYPVARAVTLAAAAVAYLTSLCLLGARRTPSPAPRTALLLMRHLPLVAVSVTLLNFVAIGQADLLAAEAVRANPGEYANGDFYLDGVPAAAWTHGAILGVAGVVALVLAGIARRRGVSAPLLVGVGVAGPVYLFLLLAAAMASPFVLSGASGEPVPQVLADGPGWYLPAIATQVSLAGLAYAVIMALMVNAGSCQPARP
ncbi:hypothetical protein Aple_060260 [Acrocarpospora pleiomorpha]|uniref:Uncharacterized protein n=1 Tax=Acrocarpospora pleiomorpha TaxID=90975 RepID=A0A5M3XP50_9ACTN|nr:hypothetical protein Aple_060260 [Acrocarpospora pleiomorpha]